VKKIYLLLLPIFLFAYELSFDIGGEKDKLSDNFLSINLSKQTPMFNLPTYTSLSIGGWEGEKDNSFIFINEGAVFGKNIYLKLQIGAGLISKTTKKLSTNFQFTEKIGAGIVYKKIDFGINFIHISNGGIKKPNGGKNFITLEISKRF